MRKAINGIFFVVVLALLFAGCNNPAGPGEESGEAEDITLTFDYKLELTTGDTYIGGTIDLKSNDNGKKLLDISKYATVIVDAELLDKDGAVLTIQENDLAQFALLENNNDWNKKIGGASASAYNMKINGKSEMSISASAKGIPAYLLIETPKANQKVYSVNVKTITFVAKVSDVVLKKVFDNGSFMDVSGNKITFKNATYSDCAVLYEFPEAVLPLTNKTVTFTFRLENYDNTLEHQLHIQAANGDSDYNGRNPTGGLSGQLYITVDDANTWGYEDGAGSFTVDGDVLEEAAKFNSKTGGSAFKLTAVRICNNGSVYQSLQRDKSYTIIFDSITVTAKE